MAKLEKKEFGPLSEWLDALIIGKANGATQFAVILRQGYSALLQPHIRYDNSEKPIELGDSLQVRIQKCLNLENHHRTRHFVTYARLCPDFAASKQLMHGRVDYYFYTTTATPCDFAADGKTMILHNDTFGCFVDKNHVIPSWVRAPVTFEFVVNRSPIDITTSIFVPTQLFKIHEDEHKSTSVVRTQLPDMDRLSIRDGKRAIIERSRQSSEGDSDEPPRLMPPYNFTYEQKKEFHDLLRELWERSVVRLSAQRLDPESHNAIMRYIALG